MSETEKKPRNRQQRQKVRAAKERGGKVRAWLEERAGLARKREEDRRKEEQKNRKSRGVDRVPSKLVGLGEHTYVPISEQKGDNYQTRRFYAKRNRARLRRVSREVMPGRDPVFGTKMHPEKVDMRPSVNEPYQNFDKRPSQRR